MRRELMLIGLLGLCAGAVNPPLFAQNPRVSVSVADATCEEAAAALSRASGISVRLDLGEALSTEAGAQAASPAPRASFEWERSTFAGALRELCDRYGVSADRDGSGGYLLHHHGDPASAAAARPVGLVEQDGTRLQVHSVSVYGNRSASFIGSAPELSNGGMRVQLQARVAEGEGGSIAGVRNVTARDDRGNQLAFLPGTGAWPFASDGTSRLPDEWSGAISFDAPDPRAKRIAALEGELMEYRSVRPLRIEVPLPLEQSTVRAEEGGLTLAVSRYRVLSATEPETGDELLPLPGTAGDSSDSGPTVRVRLFVPTGARYSDRTGTSALAPVLVGSSGKSYPAQQLRAGGGRSSATVAMQDTTWIFPGVTEEPRSLVWEIVEKKDPVRRFKFRMTDIPLPGPASLGSQGGRSVFIAP